MADSLELERTYLAKYLPADLEKFTSKEILDIYIPKAKDHPTLRIRKSGDAYMITKKEPKSGWDSSEMVEHTIPINAEEFKELSELPGKRVRKVRYYYSSNGRTSEIGIFKDDLEGLVLVDFEFDNSEAKEGFAMPEFCLIEVTDKEFLAGGMLCGKKYSDIEKDLSKFNYKKIV